MELTPDRWSTIENVYEQALARPAAERRTFVLDACGGDAALGAEILAMLVADETGSTLSIERLVGDDAPIGDPLLGATLGPWRIAGLLGRGGSGAVYLVERCDNQYEQRAALKLVASGLLTRESIARFSTERRILARLVHPHIARLMDGGLTADGTPYLVMEYVDGMALTTYCDDRRLPIEDRLRLFRMVCGAVQYAHRSLVVHRDLKPSNIYVSHAGDVKLLDFGVAKLLEADPGFSTPVTRTEHRALTLAYAAPEQLRGDIVTTAADVYALGVILFELLAGTRPLRIEGLSAAEAERAIQEREPPPPSAAAAQAPPLVAESRHTTPARLARRLRGDLDRICLMALRKEPERRYASVEQLSEDVERFLTGRPVIAQADTVRYRVRRFVARNRIAVSVAAAFVVLLSGFAVTAVSQGRLVAAERDRVRFERDKAQRVVQILVDLFRAADPEVAPGGDRQPIGEFLENAEARVLGALEPGDDFSATMKHVLGRVHGVRSDFGRARRLLEEALAESRRTRGADDPETLEVQIDLGRLLAQVDERPAARRLLEDALARCERTVGERHALTARALHMLGNAGEDPAWTRPLFTRALAIRRAVLPPDDPDLAITLDALAVLEMFQERHAEARALFEEALRVAEATHAGRNTVAFVVTNDFATLLSRTGDLAGAEVMHRRALALATELIGPQSIQAATAVNNLAAILAGQGKGEAALDLFRQAHDRYIAIAGPGHRRTANAARNAGMMLLFLGRPEEAKPWMDQAVRAIEAAEDSHARDRLYFGAQRAAVIAALGRRGEAIVALEATIARMQDIEPPEGHSGTADARVYLGSALLADGRPAAAEPHLRRALAFRARVLSDDHPQRAVAECELGRAVAAQQRGAEARPLLARCVPRIRGYGLVLPSSRQAAVELLHRLERTSP